MDSDKAKEIADALAGLRACKVSNIAPIYKLFMARVFGRRIEGRDGDTVAVCYHWKGNLYFSEMLQGPPK